MIHIASCFYFLCLVFASISGLAVDYLPNLVFIQGSHDISYAKDNFQNGILFENIHYSSLTPYHNLLSILLGVFPKRLGVKHHERINLTNHPSSLFSFLSQLNYESHYYDVDDFQTNVSFLSHLDTHLFPRLNSRELKSNPYFLCFQIQSPTNQLSIEQLMIKLNILLQVPQSIQPIILSIWKSSEVKDKHEDNFPLVFKANLAFQWSQIPNKIHDQHFLMVTDIFPTLLHLLNISLPLDHRLDGISFLPLLENSINQKISQINQPINKLGDERLILWNERIEQHQIIVIKIHHLYAIWKKNIHNIQQSYWTIFYHEQITTNSNNSNNLTSLFIKHNITSLLLSYCPEYLEKSFSFSSFLNSFSFHSNHWFETLSSVQTISQINPMLLLYILSTYQYEGYFFADLIPKKFLPGNHHLPISWYQDISIPGYCNSIDSQPSLNHKPHNKLLHHQCICHSIEDCASFWKKPTAYWLPNSLQSGLLSYIQSTKGNKQQFIEEYFTSKSYSSFCLSSMAPTYAYHQHYHPISEYLLKTTQDNQDYLFYLQQQETPNHLNSNIFYLYHPLHNRYELQENHCLQWSFPIVSIYFPYDWTHKYIHICSESFHQLLHIQQTMNTFDEIIWKSILGIYFYPKFSFQSHYFLSSPSPKSSHFPFGGLLPLNLFSSPPIQLQRYHYLSFDFQKFFLQPAKHKQQWHDDIFLFDSMLNISSLPLYSTVFTSASSFVRKQCLDSQFLPFFLISQPTLDHQWLLGVFYFPYLHSQFQDNNNNVEKKPYHLESVILTSNQSSSKDISSLKLRIQTISHYLIEFSLFNDSNPKVINNPKNNFFISSQISNYSINLTKDLIYINQTIANMNNDTIHDWFLNPSYHDMAKITIMLEYLTFLRQEYQHNNFILSRNTLNYFLQDVMYLQSNIYDIHQYRNKLLEQLVDIGIQQFQSLY